MIDSGASRHFANWNLLTPAEKATIKPLDEPITINTGNGKVYVVDCVQMWVHELDMLMEFEVSPQCAPDGPCVISLGKLFRETDGRFLWEGDSLPIIEINNREIPCWLSNEVPFMYTMHEIEDQPAEITSENQQQPNINNPGGEASVSVVPPVTPSSIFQVALKMKT